MTTSLFSLSHINICLSVSAEKTNSNNEALKKNHNGFLHGVYSCSNFLTSVIFLVWLIGGCAGNSCHLSVVDTLLCIYIYNSCYTWWLFLFFFFEVSLVSQLTVSVLQDWWSDLLDNNCKEVDYSGKMVLLLDILTMSSNVGDKALVFSQSLSTLDLIEQYLSKLTRPGKKGKYWKRRKDWYRCVYPV